MTSLPIIQSIVAIVGGLVAAYFAIINFRRSILQREEELRWKRANTAREVIKELHAHEKASDAVLMLDWYINTNVFTDKKYDQNKEVVSSYNISYDEVIKALSKVDETSTIDKKEYYILDCFDWFFYYIDRIEQYLRNQLILFPDIVAIFYPYFLKVTADQHKALYTEFMTRRHYNMAIEFWDRFNSCIHSPGKQ